jgi:DNA-binding response OmpR family regulator
VSGPHLDLSRLNVLIVDQNWAMRALLNRVLRSLGLRFVIQTDTAMNAMELLRDDDIDLVTLDYRLPDMNGVELTRLIRNQDTSPSPFVPILMITGHTEPDTVMKARDAGINELIAKPVSVESIAHRLTLMIEKARPFVTAPGYFGPDRRRRRQPPEGAPRRRASDAPGRRQDGELAIAG